MKNKLIGTLFGIIVFALAHVFVGIDVVEAQELTHNPGDGLDKYEPALCFVTPGVQGSHCYTPSALGPCVRTNDCH